MKVQNLYKTIELDMNDEILVAKIGLTEDEDILAYVFGNTKGATVGEYVHMENYENWSMENQIREVYTAKVSDILQEYGKLYILIVIGNKHDEEELKELYKLYPGIKISDYIITLDFEDVICRN